MSSSSSQRSKPPKISLRAFQASAGLLLGVAVVVAGARITARYLQTHRIKVDDSFFFLALVTLVAGTCLLYLDLPYIYLQEDVEAGLRPAPTNLVSQLLHGEELQDAAAMLLGATVMSVKFSFLFFFRGLIRQQKRLMIWWWCILAVLIPTTAIIMFSVLITCPYFDQRIFVKCVTPAALASQNATLKANAILDIITDAFLISIPVVLLWNVQISLGRKIALWGVLCLGIFTAITAIIKVAGSNINNGQVDSAWAIFWLQAEAAVAVIVVSINAFRALFVAHRASKHQSPGQNNSSSRSIWSKKMRFRSSLPEIPSPTFTGVRTYIRQCPYDADDTRDIELPSQAQRILVTHNMSLAKTHQHGAQRPSVETFV